MSQTYSNVRKLVAGRLMATLTEYFDEPVEDVLGAIADMNAMVPLWLGLPAPEGEDAPAQTEKPTSSEEKPRRGKKASAAPMSPEVRDAIAANPLSLPTEAKPETAPAVAPAAETAPAVPETPPSPPAQEAPKPEDPPAAPPAAPAAPEVPVYDSTNKEHKRELARLLQEVHHLDLTQKDQQGFATAVNLAINGKPIPTSIEADLGGLIGATLAGLRPAAKAPF
jgi:hypothetical protein